VTPHFLDDVLGKYFYLIQYLVNMVLVAHHTISAF
jgi:hypothetical protein